jgi:hypothetical protein
VEDVEREWRRLLKVEMMEGVEFGISPGRELCQIFG